MIRELMKSAYSGRYDIKQELLKESRSYEGLTEIHLCRLVFELEWRTLQRPEALIEIQPARFGRSALNDEPFLF